MATQRRFEVTRGDATVTVYYQKKFDAESIGRRWPLVETAVSLADSMRRRWTVSKTNSFGSVVGDARDHEISGAMWKSMRVSNSARYVRIGFHGRSETTAQIVTPREYAGSVYVIDKKTQRFRWTKRGARGRFVSASEGDITRERGLQQLKGQAAADALNAKSKGKKKSGGASPDATPRTYEATVLNRRKALIASYSDNLNILTPTRGELNEWGSETTAWMNSEIERG